MRFNIKEWQDRNINEEKLPRKVVLSGKFEVKMTPKGTYGNATFTEDRFELFLNGVKTGPTFSGTKGQYTSPINEQVPTVLRKMLKKIGIIK